MVMHKGYLLAFICLGLLPSLAPAEGKGPDCLDYQFFGRLDFLYWAVKDAPIPTLVVSQETGPLGPPAPITLLSDSISYDPLPGVRVLAGLWFDMSGTVGAEGSGFYFGQHTVSQSFTGNDAGLPFLAIPFVDTQTGETAVVISNPLTNNGGFISASETIRFGGANLDFVFNQCRTPNRETNYLLGFRTLYLEEILALRTRTHPLGGFLLFRNDSFQTRNFFYGGELGARSIFRKEICFLEVTGKVAVGNNLENVTILGVNRFRSKDSIGGIFAQPSNIGSYSRNQLVVAPEAQVRLGLELSDHLKVSLGYDVLWMSSVARPGDQIDRQIGPGFRDNPDRPFFDEAAIRNDTFWVQGASLGLEIRY
jgi:hypothetical protein